ncbi:hypothetical protein GCM10010387_52820 [Streptomyces inusitatus]|uniref:Uncharacterized protein n=1 Tax=Streptomyces inusitatus TaxID=68221 RepID=A0A918QKG7_9ACTN|nr:hypothetical protein GCM10010387_52820 [Streptomyces inusitatus]
MYVGDLRALGLARPLRVYVGDSRPWVPCAPSRVRQRTPGPYVRHRPGFPFHRFADQRILSVRAIRHQDSGFDRTVLWDDLVVTGEELSTLDPEPREEPLTPLHS